MGIRWGRSSIIVWSIAHISQVTPRPFTHIPQVRQMQWRRDGQRHIIERLSGAFLRPRHYLCELPIINVYSVLRDGDNAWLRRTYRVGRGDAVTSPSPIRQTLSQQDGRISNHDRALDSVQRPNPSGVHPRRALGAALPTPMAPNGRSRVWQRPHR